MHAIKFMIHFSVKFCVMRSLLVVEVLNRFQKRIKYDKETAIYYVPFKYEFSGNLQIHDKRTDVQKKFSVIFFRFNVSFSIFENEIEMCF